MPRGPHPVPSVDVPCDPKDVLREIEETVEDDEAIRISIHEDIMTVINENLPSSTPMQEENTREVVHEQLEGTTAEPQAVGQRGVDENVVEREVLQREVETS